MLALVCKQTSLFNWEYNLRSDLGRDSYFGMISELLEAWVLVLLASAVVFEENVHKETPDFKWVSEDKD